MLNGWRGKVVGACNLTTHPNLLPSLRMGRFIHSLRQSFRDVHRVKLTFILSSAHFRVFLRSSSFFVFCLRMQRKFCFLLGWKWALRTVRMNFVNLSVKCWAINQFGTQFVFIFSAITLITLGV
jgi:hypothetical protein